MKKEDLVNYAREYIIEQLSNGFSFNDIKAKLLEVGYSEDIIKEALVDKKDEEINSLKEENKKLRVENIHLKRDIESLKEEKPHSNVFLITIILIVVCIVAFSFGYIFKDIIKKESFSDYIGQKFGNNIQSIENESSNLTSLDNGDSSIILGSSENESSNISEVNLNTCSNLNGYLCINNEVCNGILLNSIENNCCSILCESTTVLENCEYLSCNSPNLILPCICGNIIADNENPWCCASSNQVFSNVENENCIFCGGFLTPPGSP